MASISRHDDTLWLTLDQGGHASRAMVFDQQGTLRAHAESAVSTSRPRPGWVEQDADAVIDSFEQALAGISLQLGTKIRQIKAAGLATQRASLVCWNRTTGAALTPVLSWQDRRNTDWLRQFEASGERIRRITGLRISPHYGASKYRWCLDNIAEIQQALAGHSLAMGPLASFILFRLLEERPFVVDCVNASRTLLWDINEHNWSSELLDLFTIPAETLPVSVPNRFEAGHLALQTTHIPLCLAIGDQPAVTFAAGSVDHACVFINIGTGAFVQQYVGQQPVIADGLLTSLILQDEGENHYVLEGTINGAGSAVNINAVQLGLDPYQCIRDAQQWLADESMRPPLYLNGIAGLGAPYWRPNFKSGFIGTGSPEARMLAVLESIVFLIQTNLEKLKEFLEKPGKLVITGGLGRLDGLCQRIADLSGVQVERPQLHEATAVGVARLLSRDRIDWPTRNAELFTPRKNRSLQQRYRRWRTAMHKQLTANDSLQ